MPRTNLFLAAVIALLLAAAGSTQTKDSKPQAQGGTPVMKHATGTFEVKTKPQADPGSDPNLTRLTLEKQFHGDLEGSSKGQMLGAYTDVKGSAGYVAMEKVDGKLNGRSGTFMLQHSGTMQGGKLQLSVTVVPDSGTGELTGLAGTMKIIMAEGKHSYDFEYSLPETR
jgi:uncharacterized protein DUF3224